VRAMLPFCLQTLRHMAEGTVVARFVTSFISYRFSHLFHIFIVKVVHKNNSLLCVGFILSTDTRISNISL
jgi:hypothetical protein